MTTGSLKHEVLVMEEFQILTFQSPMVYFIPSNNQYAIKK